MKINDSKSIDNYRQNSSRNIGKTCNGDRFSVKKVKISKTENKISKLVLEKSKVEKYSMKVEEIKNQISNGSYKISSKEIGKKIIDNIILQRGRDI